MVDLRALANRYSSLETPELVSLHQSGTLLEETYPVLESELKARGVVVASRPAVRVFPPELPFFSSHWFGLQSARSATVFVAAVVPTLSDRDIGQLLTTARSTRVRDKVPNPGVGARGAHAERRVRATIFGVAILGNSAGWALGVETYEGPDAATVQGQFKKTATFGWDMLQFVSVDGQRISGIRAQDRARAVLHLHPGEHDIVVAYHSCKGFLRGCVEVVIRLGATLKPNGRYALSSTRVGDKVQAWIEQEDTHEHVSRILGASGKTDRKSEEPAADAGQ